MFCSLPLTNMPSDNNQKYVQSHSYFQITVARLHICPGVLQTQQEPGRNRERTENGFPWPPVLFLRLPLLRAQEVHKQSSVFSLSLRCIRVLLIPIHLIAQWYPLSPEISYIFHHLRTQIEGAGSEPGSHQASVLFLDFPASWTERSTFLLLVR